VSRSTKKETKMATQSVSQKQVMSDFATTFEAFKDANDERLSALEAKQGVDPLVEQKVDRINAALDLQQKHIERLGITASQPSRVSGVDLGASETKSAWADYIRSGDLSAMKALEGKSLSLTDNEGGYLVPLETESSIERALAEASPFRAIATVRSVGTSQFRAPISAGGASSGWAGDTDERPETQAPLLELVEFPVGELYAMPAATQSLLDDSVADVDQWLAEEVRDVFATQETTAFVSGDGVNKPRGFLDYPQVADENHSWNNLGYLSTGTDGDFNADAPIDALLDLIYAPQPRFRAQASFMMNRRTVSAVRKFKDADGNYIWQPATQAGASASLLGYPLVEIEDMPDIGVDMTPIAFGDFRRGYLITDRQGVRVLRDPFSSKPYVLFYTTKRVGGGVQDFNAIKLLKFSA